MNETQQFILQNRFEDVNKLAFASHHPEVDLSFALSQIAGRQAIKNKVPSWHENDDILYPPHLSLEQCSSEPTAIYKASLIGGNSFVDLTGGFGIDAAFLSSKFKSTMYVEQQENLCKIASHNFQTLQLNNIKVIHQNSEIYLDSIETQVDCIFIDPARRSNTGKKTVAIEDCEPNIVLLKEKLLAKASLVMIKLSPMLDISLALRSLPETYAVHIVSVGGECKELLFLLNKEKTTEPEIRCINILKNESIQSFSFFKSEEQQTVVSYANEPEIYLYEPNASILKAGAYKSIGASFSLKKLHPDSHLYTSSEYIANFPGRSFKIDSYFSLSKKEIKDHLQNISQANISIRNFPGSVDELRKRFKIKDGGNIYLFATTLYSNKKVILKTSSC